MRSKEEITRLLAQFEDTLVHRYAAAFPRDPLPMKYWHRGPGSQLDRLMEGAKTKVDGRDAKVVLHG